MRKKLRSKLVHFVVKHLLKTITEEDVLRANSYGKLVCRGRVISDEEQEAIQREAEYIKNSVTYKLLMKDMNYLANQTMFEKSASFDDMLFGKAQLYVLDVLNKKLHNLAE